MLRALVGYAGVLNDQNALATAALRQTIATHMHDLAALLLGHGATPQLSKGLRAARLRAVKEDILQKVELSNLGNLSVDEVTRTHRICYMRQLFATEGTTFTDFVREARRARAYELLTQPGQFVRPIHTIAYKSGFGDLSYFNRAFRRRYNMTPSEARELARRKEQSSGAQFDARGRTSRHAATAGCRDGVDIASRARNERAWRAWIWSAMARPERGERPPLRFVDSPGTRKTFRKFANRHLQRPTRSE